MTPSPQAIAQTTDCFRLSNPFEGMFEVTWEDLPGWNGSAKLNTDDAPPVGPGDLEVEFAYGHTRAHKAWGNRWEDEGRGLLEERTYDLGLSYGLWEDWELDLGLSLYSDLVDREISPFNSGGIGDTEVGLKKLLHYDEDREFYLTYSQSVTIPTGKEGSVRDALGHSQEYWTLNQRLIATQFIDRWTWTWDFGYALPLGSKRNEERGTLDTNLAIGYHIRPWFQPEVELNYAHDFIDAGQDADVLAVTYGVVLLPSEKWRIGLGFQDAVAGRNTDDTTTGHVVVTYFH